MVQIRVVRKMIKVRLAKADWEEDKHPRAADGKFGSGSGSGSSDSGAKDAPAPKAEAAPEGKPDSTKEHKIPAAGAPLPTDKIAETPKGKRITPAIEMGMALTAATRASAFDGKPVYVVKKEDGTPYATRTRPETGAYSRVSATYSADAGYSVTVDRYSGENAAEAVKEPVAEPKAEAVKEPWEMTRGEFVESRKNIPHVGDEMHNRNSEQMHRANIKAAIAQGKTVPPEVMADYGDLSEKKDEKPKQPKDKVKPEAEPKQVQSEEKKTEKIGNYLYFKDDNGELFRATANSPVDVNGWPMGARWESPAWQADQRLQMMRDDVKRIEDDDKKQKQESSTDFSVSDKNGKTVVSRGNHNAEIDFNRYTGMYQASYTPPGGGNPITSASMKGEDNAIEWAKNTITAHSEAKPVQPVKQEVKKPSTPKQPTKDNPIKEKQKSGAKATQYPKAKQDKFFILGRKTPEGEFGFSEIDAKPVKLEGVPQYEFFVHKLGNDWVVSEAQTGMSVNGTVSSARKTKAAAIQSATDNITKTGVDKFHSVLNSAVSKTGLSPRYSDPAPQQPPQPATAAGAGAKGGAKADFIAHVEKNGWQVAKNPFTSETGRDEMMQSGYRPYSIQEDGTAKKGYAGDSTVWLKNPDKSKNAAYHETDTSVSAKQDDDFTHIEEFNSGASGKKQGQQPEKQPKPKADKLGDWSSAAGAGAKHTPESFARLKAFGRAKDLKIEPHGESGGKPQYRATAKGMPGEFRIVKENEKGKLKFNGGPTYTAAYFEDGKQVGPTNYGGTPWKAMGSVVMLSRE
jgi:hypothetical protein